MNPDFFGELINGAIPLLGGIYLTLLGFRRTGKQPGVSPSFDEWHRRYGRLLKVIGPALIIFGPGLWLMNWARMGPPVGDWKRYSTSDGVCSIEFPASPKATNQKAQRVTSTGMSLALQGSNTYYALTHSDEFADDAAQTDEQRLDLIRDNFPEVGKQLGVEYNGNSMPAKSTPSRCESSSSAASAIEQSRLSPEKTETASKPSTSWNR
jgi:hypothetical protein